MMLTLIIFQSVSSAQDHTLIGLNLILRVLLINNILIPCAVGRIYDKTRGAYEMTSVRRPTKLIYVKLLLM